MQMLSEDYQTILESDCTLYGEEQAVFAVPVIKDGKLAQIVAGAESQSVLFAVNESDPCEEKTAIILKDTETGITLRLKQDDRASIEEQRLSEFLHLAENRGESSVIRQGRFMMSTIPVNGTSWVQIMIRNMDDHISQMSLHISLYLLLLGASLLLFCFSIRRMKRNMAGRKTVSFWHGALCSSAELWRAQWRILFDSMAMAQQRVGDQVLILQGIQHGQCLTMKAGAKPARHFLDDADPLAR